MIGRNAKSAAGGGTAAAGGVEIRVTDLVCRFGGDDGAPALDGLHLTAARGGVTAVVGPSGAGKSTLLRAVAGLVRPVRGDVLLDGRSALGLPPEKRRLGMVFQSYALFPHLTVADNVAFAPRVRGVGRGAARRRIEGVLERLEIAHLAERHPHQLSGGERQRVALARALAAEPRALLLDEPLAALDARLRLALRAELGERLRAAGLTALYVTHDQEEAMALGDRVAVLRGGRLEQVGTPEELYTTPATPFVAAFVGEANFLPVTWRPERRELSGPLGTFRVDAATAERFDGVARGRLMVRPEAIRLGRGGGRSGAAGDTGEAGEGTLAGRVLDATFLGGRRRLRVEVAGLERPLKVDLPAGAPVAAGATVPLEIDFGATALLREFDPDEEVVPR